jgi:hypothetical protein
MVNLPKNPKTYKKKDKSMEAPDKCCEKCRHDISKTKTICTRRPCNIVNEYDLFEPIGEVKEKTPTLFVSYHFYAPYESGQLHKDFGNIFLDVAEPTTEEGLQKLESMISENLHIRIGFKTSSVTVLNFKTITTDE